jgi:aminoglycoside phosphotransferase (APT) family kinase protein
MQVSDTVSRSELFTGTRPVAEQHRFDIAALEAYLREHVEGFAGPLSVEQFKGGQSNPTFKLITPGKTYVMRAKPGPAAKLLPSAHAIDREFRVMRGLAGTRCQCLPCTCARTSQSSVARST